MTKTNLVIVGAGLFGNIIAAYARAVGHTVTVIGDNRPLAASAASGCVLSPNWLNSMSSEDIADALSVLKSLYTLNSLDFKTNLLVKFKAKHIDPASILMPPDVLGRVTEVSDGVVSYQDAQNLPCTARGVVVVAAGIWSGELIKDLPPIKGLYGASLRLPGKTDPRLEMYAPYRQSVGFNITPDSIWFGDGSALIEKTWKTENAVRIQKIKDRAAHLLGVDASGAVVTEGARPYVTGNKGGYLCKVSPQLWVATGGAKNGTVLAASHALKLVNSL